MSAIASNTNGYTEESCGHGYTILDGGIEICNYCHKPIRFFRKSDYGFLDCYFENGVWWINKF